MTKKDRVQIVENAINEYLAAKRSKRHGKRLYYDV